jgi:hypothetical protein
MSKKKNRDSSDRPNPYFIDKFASIPARYKIGFFKFWIAGMTFFLSFYGLGISFDYLDRFVIWILLMVLSVEYFVIPVINWMHTADHGTERFLPHQIKRKSILSLLATMIYIIIIATSIHFTLYLWVDVLEFRTIGDIISESTADPFTFGVLYLLYDIVWCRVRMMIVKWKRRKEIES